MTLEVFDDTDQSHFRSSGNRSQSTLKREVNLRGEWSRFWACEGNVQGKASSDSAAVRVRGSGLSAG